ncbi:hypothetical protein OCK02_05475 (plasmid) [Rhizobium sp. TRM96647]|uniref:hypothetical protein n=1 Tax=unclassified Rhizobium TaxID=2613769 RepID=UPI0021E7E2FE|nr:MULTISPECIES: hypothetical protein [unclassified Rhizobium]MCV3735649.1 hypothetical protein [Rhizobium sp. TRM96647]MCV3757588.1 hypothetical protein [Rhizobium sp. TRM96650]
MNSFIASLIPRLIRGVAACALLAAAHAAPVHAEDMMKSDILQPDTMSTEATQPGAVPAAGTTTGTKADCLHMAEMETDSVKKAEMTKACEAMQ